MLQIAMHQYQSLIVWDALQNIFVRNGRVGEAWYFV